MRFALNNFARDVIESDGRTTNTVEPFAFRISPMFKVALLTQIKSAIEWAVSNHKPVPIREVEALVVPAAEVQAAAQAVWALVAPAEATVAAAVEVPAVYPYNVIPYLSERATTALKNGSLALAEMSALDPTLYELRR